MKAILTKHFNICGLACAKHAVFSGTLFSFLFYQTESRISINAFREIQSSDLQTNAIKHMCHEYNF